MRQKQWKVCFCPAEGRSEDAQKQMDSIPINNSQHFIQPGGMAQYDI